MVSTPPKLWLVRHAAPLVEPGTCYGALDVPADAGATAAAAAALAAALPWGITVQVSPLRRCRQLADALQALRPDLAPRTDGALAEMDFGAWEGLRWDVIGQPAIDKWTRNFAHHRPGGGESVAQFLGRVSMALETLRDAAAPGRRGAAWITHAGVIRAALLRHEGVPGVPQARDWPVEAPAFGAWQVLALDRADGY